MSEEPIHFSPDSQFIYEPKQPSKLSKFFRAFFLATVLAVIVIAGLYFYIAALNEPLDDFPVNRPINIEQGTEVKKITEILENEGVVQSDSLLYYALVLLYDSTDIKASSYVFEEPLTTFEIAERLTKGDFDTDLIRFTHFEGERVSLLAERAEAILPNFNATSFTAAAEPLEGKLFPDTYFVPTTYTDAELLELLSSTFDEKMLEIDELIQGSSYTLDKILILASIIEREANTVDSKKTISGIFQNRLNAGMPLQADASIEYVLDKPLSELTAEDLEIDSPYNTYLYPGLPPTPIGNPGLDAIMAVLEPTESEYYYYITDNDGEFHYAETYTKHLRNIEIYLR